MAESVRQPILSKKTTRKKCDSMKTKKTKWLIYTVLVGLIPIMSRMLIWFVTNDGNIDILNASDFVAFGLVLHISNINEIEHIDSEDKQWKTVQNGVSITFIAFYSVLFAISIFGSTQPAIIDVDAIKQAAILLSIVSFALSYTVYHRVSAIEGGQ